MRAVFKCGRSSAVYSSLIFGFNGFIAYRINTGGVTDPLWFFLPAIVLTLVWSKEKRYFIYICAILNILVLFTGHGLLYASLLLFLFCFL